MASSRAKAPAKTAQPVQRKASQRKGRSAEVQYTSRVPAQERSRKRYETVLAATEQLLETSNIEDISFYDIARTAEISPASVHYLFPTISAVHVELNRRYNERITERLLEAQAKLVGTGSPTWQDWIRVTYEEARNFYNAHRPVREVLLGPLLNRECRLAGINGNQKLSEAKLQRLRQLFEVPENLDLNTAFFFAAEIVESIWANGNARHGHIDEVSFEESVRASIAYLRTVLPERMASRKPEPAGSH